MSKAANKTMIGLFVVGAIVLIVVAIGVLGSGKLFKESVPFVMVFEGSVKGLNVGSPVMFRGVKIGAVSSIRMRADYATKAMTILVYADAEPGQIENVNIDEATAKALTRKDRYANIKQLIARGLRAQLEMQSIVTGQLLIAVDFHPDKPAVYAGIDKTIQEIPTIPTPLQELGKKLQSLPIEDIFQKLELALDGIAKVVQAPEFKEVVPNLNTALKDAQTLVRNVDAQIKPLSADVSETLRGVQKLVKNADAQVVSLGPNLNEAVGDGRKLIRNVDGSVESIKVSLEGTLSAATSALKQAEKLFEDLDSSAAPDASLMYRLNETLREVGKAARSLSTLADYLERHPEALLGGKGDGGGK
jgi:paraquat-inducible protein B